ncbi:ClpP/crotonase [Glarea lozoyensis ATCC 20868]|uniref:ClpP/crotonase n=1 Tax=Glarea lozoyensis (strain ATCC 20868 / MF5171) TaxID=1116229 RepID=S3CS12_GLAL2|nr:ClpP/crotonase [Glarea lozoyensis ATCC 20868]EPE28465.1 ClpP/crotonase [Glarea lozoyensis ATCC 20868]
MASNLETPPPDHPTFLLSYPSPGVLVVTINRPKQMNSLPSAAHWEAQSLFTWYDHEPSLLVAIITGSGLKTFCSGQDLIEQNQFKINPPPMQMRRHPPAGFCGISRRTGKKPIIAAVNGFALGGGMEIVLNCDMTVASPTSSFSLPEVNVGLYAAAGGLPRLVHTLGMPLASEIALTGRRLTATEALSFHLINRVSSSPESLLDETIDLAKKIAAQSPDAVIVTRAGLREAWETASVENATKRVSERYDKGIFEGENVEIGLKAFKDKSKPVWKASKL